jgi:hypothetical protein
MLCQVSYRVIASVVCLNQQFRLCDEKRESVDLHAGIPTCDYEYFALEIGKSVRMESHVRR